MKQCLQEYVAGIHIRQGVFSKEFRCEKVRNVLALSYLQYLLVDIWNQFVSAKLDLRTTFKKLYWTFVSPNIAIRNGSIVWRHGPSTQKYECYLEIYLTAQNTRDHFLKIWLTLGGGIEVFMLFRKKYRLICFKL